MPTDTNANAGINTNTNTNTSDSDSTGIDTGADSFGRTWQRRDTAPDERAWAELTVPALPSVTERHPSPVHWRSLVLDPELAGPVQGRARPRTVVLVSADRPDAGWRLPVADVLPTPLAWHPRLPKVAGLAVRDRRAYPWIADYGSRTVRLYEEARAATSLTGQGGAPLAWLGDDRLALLVPGPAVTGAGTEEPPPWRAAVFEAVGPHFITFEPGQEELLSTAGACPAVLIPAEAPTADPAEAVQDPAAEVTVLGPPMLVRCLTTDEDGGLLLGHVHPSGTGPDEHGLYWATSLLHPRQPGRLRPMPQAAPAAPPAAPRRAASRTPAPEAARRTTRTLTTGHADAGLTLLPGGTGPLLLWIRALRRGEAPSGSVPTFLTAAGHRAAVLDLPLHWPDDASLALLHGQITDAVRGALEMVGEHADTVAVGGHSFGATLALYALAQLPGIAAGIAHSGCYNRTLTPTGFHYERRSLWHAPEVYQAFSALHFADRLDRPVLLVHGAEDMNPATTPDQAVELYRGIVATGGHARLVLLPQEGHTFHSREALGAVTDEHRAWLGKLETS
ncbi:alpha/beta hydrolase family protein [Streptomyces sp. NPDC088400]|uniref:S9 family peptidase n=1 Tax=Streptomyces sp. NPDC088400 TaxID=3365861 RepID=UPI0037F1E97A